MNETVSIISISKSEDPLSAEAINFLLQCGEENAFVDFKETFQIDNEKEWLEITKDVSAFVNTNGGYLVFGVRDKTYEHIGLEESVSLELADVNRVMQKINKFIEPEISNIRTKRFIKDNKKFIILYVPESTGITHMISKDGYFTFQSGGRKLILHQGTFYLRRSGFNHLADPRDLEMVINKRIELFKGAILGKIAKVVEAPRESEVFLISPDPTGNTKYSFRIDNAPESIPIKGMTFTVSPQTPEEEVAAWIAMWQKDVNAIPSPQTLWRWYVDRESFKLSAEQKLFIAKFSLLSGLPVFYWLQGLPGEKIKNMLKDATVDKMSIDCMVCIVRVSVFFGKSFHRSIIESIGRKRTLSPRLTKFPENSPREMFHLGVVESVRKGMSKKIKEEEFRLTLKAHLQNTAEAFKRGNYPYSSVLQMIDAMAFDCYLYAQDHYR